MLNLFKFKKQIPDWSFQENAISALIKDFRATPNGRFLLVLPTGGGKTMTAIRTLNEIITKRLISNKGRVLWVVHTIALAEHAKENLIRKENYSEFKLDPSLKTRVDVKMKTEAVKSLKEANEYELIVIDEAHHAAASTYEELFEYPLGVLGLTATPHRMDQKELPFNKISYSITFRDLIRRGVILLPKFLPEVRSNLVVDAYSLQADDQLEKFNNETRNRLISETIFQEARKHGLKKIIVFAGTNSHVESLYKIIAQDNLMKKEFGHIGFIYGGNKNEKGVSNSEYLKWHHSQESSILVNCKILNEGYDDPHIDSIVMATPTNSILYYMQCIGRVVRTPRNKVDAKAYVIEIVDRLPNISYRIDNRWLFAEVSDYLEPVIQDIKLKWPLSVFSIIKAFLRLRVHIKDLSIKEIYSLLIGKRISFILFNDVPQNGYGKWRIMPIPENDYERIQFFNEMSENIEENYPLNHEYILEQKYPTILKFRPFNDRVYCSSLMGALHRADLLKQGRKKVDSLYYLSVN